MNKATEKLQNAQDIFQSLTTEQQHQIKTQEPETYHALFGGDTIPNTYYLDLFIEKYSETPLEDKEKIDLSVETEGNDFKNAKFNNVPSDIVKARDIFHNLSIPTQKMIKDEKPEIYQMLFDVNVFVDKSSLSAFIDVYKPVFLKIKTFSDFDNMPLDDQLDFKNNLPGEYYEIMGIND
ncbi:hypothetical protein [Chryseobacterium sp. T20]|uniref:hypothetical protein n=1 Tax=Chryseobacterium sp. T20 TaxID=3395375 RepID=UPI0039BCA415